MKNYTRKLVIDRIKGLVNGVGDAQTLGNFFVVSLVIEKNEMFIEVPPTDTRMFNVRFRGVTLELPWRNNEKNISCIPTGEYDCVKYFRWSKGYWAIKVLNVPNRSLIRIHPANYYTDLRGCIGVGRGFVDINHDGYSDITNSRQTLKRLLKNLPFRFKLEIK